jgi:hypothetical protein
MVALRLGQKVHVGRYEAHLFGEFAKTVGSEVGKGYGRKIIQKAAFVTLGELSPEGLDTATVDITKETDLKIAFKSLERSKHWQVTAVVFSIKEQAEPKGG